MKSLIYKSIAGLFFLFVVLGLALFLPAQTIYYLQAWIYLIIFAILAIIITIYLFINDKSLLERRVKQTPINETRLSQKIIQSLASVFFCLMFILSGFDYRFKWSKVPIYLSIIAEFFIVLGFLIIFWTFKENSFTSGVIEVDKDQKVISTGLYGIIRHPMYLGGLLVVIFSPFALGSYWAIFCIVPLTIVIITRILDEEKYLSETLTDYSEYNKKVRYRLIPFIW